MMMMAKSVLLLLVFFLLPLGVEAFLLETILVLFTTIWFGFGIFIVAFCCGGFCCLLFAGPGPGGRAIRY
jgi:hypothetical protein